MRKDITAWTGKETSSIILKTDSIWMLNQSKNGNEKHDKKIDKVIEIVSGSLDEKYWVDSLRLNPENGKQVFIEERKAILACRADLEPDCSFINSRLAFADWLIAQIAVDDAKKY